jgi:hypothetical protein
MTWGAPLTWGTAVGHVKDTLRIGIVKNGRNLGVCIVIPHAMADELEWTPETSLDLQPGEGDHHGWLRLSPSQSPGARRLRTTGKSKNLRLVTPLWPWMVNLMDETRALEVIESRVALQASTMQFGAVVDVRLPGWAEPERPDAPVAASDRWPPPKPIPPMPRLADMPHPLPPGVPVRREPRTQQERAAPR